MPITPLYQINTTEKSNPEYALKFKALAPTFYEKLLQKAISHDWETYYQILTEGPTSKLLPPLLVNVAEEIFNMKEAQRSENISTVFLATGPIAVQPPASFLEIEYEDYEYTLSAFLQGKTDQLNKKLRMQDHPLHWLLFIGRSFDYIALMVNFGCDVNAIGRKNNTPLHYAVKRMLRDLAHTSHDNIKEEIIKDNTRIIDLLLKKGADPTLKNSDNVTPLDLAKPYPAITQLFNEAITLTNSGKKLRP